MKRIILAALFVTVAWGQAFEVASIRPRDNDRGIFIRFSGSRLTAGNVSLSNLIGFAWNLKIYQILGLPGWGQTESYDVVAKAEGDGELTREQARPMMKLLLAERFSLKIHSEMKEVPVYNLVTTKGGPKLTTPAPDAKFTLMSTGETVTVTAGSMIQLAEHLSNRAGIGRPVIDRTGLTGTYNYNLKAATDESKADLDRPSIFTAVQDQLGLKLEPAKAQIEVWVVDHADRPSEN